MGILFETCQGIIAGARENKNVGIVNATNVAMTRHVRKQRGGTESQEIDTDDGISTMISSMKMSSTAMKIL
jgi:hypothetical protein